MIDEIRIGNKSDAEFLVIMLLEQAWAYDRLTSVLEKDLPELIPGLEALKDALERDVI